jgi:pimeloyl-ACP methyl ester carboxylesterase
MRVFFAAILSLLPALALATPSMLNTRGDLPDETCQTSNANCKRHTYTVTSKANRTVFNKEALYPQTNQSRITELFVEFVTNSTKFTSDYITGYKEVTQDFQISGILCTPKKNADSSRAIQLLVHGIGFDSSYWNYQGAGVPESHYSYVYQAAEQGITTFRYDRIGTGDSERPSDGVNQVQAATEVGVLMSMANKLKNTTEIGGKKWEKVLLIGHSYGSVQSQAVTHMNPAAVDGVILTGYSASTVGVPFYLTSTVYTMAKMVFPDRFGGIPSEWLVTGTPYSAQQNFLYPATVIPASVTLNRETEQPVTQGSLFTIGSVDAPAPGFTGPVQVVTGQEDFIFFFDQPYMNGVSLAQSAATTLYPNSKNATSYTPGKTGHGINVHTTALSIYKEMLSFAKTNGL